MACLKIFSGVFPEIMEEIIRYLRNDFSTLHSCILVNRLWCRLTIPLLWEDPFSIATRNFHFIEIYLHELNNDDKTKLINYRMKNDIIPLNTLFNYSSFIKKLNTKHIIYIIEIWIKEARSLTNKDRAGYKYKECTRLVYEFLFKIFTNNANLNTFEIVLMGYRWDLSFFLKIYLILH
uniref:F-box domain-containing protein n=1 Tax=Rhizophagus irregularis (strain DAOM 181602 / DAOM 197198 / MUCL 43194) TaxID=747089 RepID=U9U413_RHIID